jgi:hypothetical protein
LKWLLKFCERDYISMLETVYPEDKIRERWKEILNRFMTPTVLFVIIALFSILSHSSWMYLIFGLVVSYLIWKAHYINIKQMSKLTLLKKRVSFTSFMRVLPPIVEEGDMSFIKSVKQALSEDPDTPIREEIQNFISELTRRPNDSEVFVEFADKASGLDSADTLCSTLYEFYQHTSDPEIINSLTKTASDELFRGREKIKKLDWAGLPILRLRCFWI